MGIIVPLAVLATAPPLRRGCDTHPNDGRRGDGRVGDDLPAEIAFLRGCGVDERALRAATAEGLRCGVDASTALLAAGAVTDTLYYHGLAHHLDLPFALDWPRLVGDARPALREGRARRADGGWLLAPTAETLRLLLEARRRGMPLGAGWSITTPAHLAALVARRLPVARLAGEGLAEAAPDLSARGALRGRRGAMLALATLCGLASLAAGSRLAIDLLGATFLAALVFRLMVSAAGWSTAGSAVEPLPAPALPDARLPTYSVLVPLRDEAGMVPHLVSALAALDYPPAKLDVLFLVEADDASTRVALLAARLPPHMRVVVVPAGEPRTKPRALNVGLMLARGELVTVYDAEDCPAPDQLRQAAARFAAAGPDLACLQARLAVSNGAEGMLERLFAIEYAGLFDNLQPGAARLALPLALGGTSNHFDVGHLRRAGGWDSFNVTEDADLGLRLARLGYRVGDLASTTAERAEREPTAWFNQRRRWTKGWMQTALVLSRRGAVRDLGARQSAAVALMMVNLVGGPLFAPVALPLLAIHLARVGLPAPAGAVELCEATLAASVFALGVATPLWCGYAGCRARGLRVGAALALVLPYQLMIAGAAWGGLVDLVRRPYHWRKTPHTPESRPSRSSP